jgi:hypothetical protein
VGWQKCLASYPKEKAKFLLDIIKYGYKLVDEATVWAMEPISVKNYPSVLDHRFVQVNKTIKEDLDRNWVEVWPHKPRVVTARGAVPKPHAVDAWRIITDLSSPKGKSVNDLVDPPKFSLAKFDDALRAVARWCWLAKVDLASAYRHVPIHPTNWELFGFEWEGKYYVDKQLCFGLNTAPWVFTQFTEAVVWIAKQRGIKNIVGYIDDFLIVADTYEECLIAYNALRALLDELGFSYGEKKCVPPCQCLDFLGITIDSTVPEARLSSEQRERIERSLASFLDRNDASARELQSLAGSLNCASKVVYGGRTFLRRLLDNIKEAKDWDEVIPLSASCKLDLVWWRDFMSEWDGKALLLDKTPVSPLQFQTDACTGVGCGAFFEGDWLQERWCEGISDHINTLEVFPVLLSARKWASHWQGRHVVVWTDNTATLYAINKGTSKTPVVMSWLRELFYLSAVNNFRITARHIPGKFNELADALSRFEMARFRSALARWRLAREGHAAYACYGAEWLSESLRRHNGMCGEMSIAI